jgi:four helix bundle protein
MLCESATAIATNIVGGYKKKDREEKLFFLTTAQEALEECRYYITLATDLHLLDSFQADELENNLNEVSYLLNSYARSIKRRKEGDYKRDDESKEE